MAYVGLVISVIALGFSIFTFFRTEAKMRLRDMRDFLVESSDNAERLAAHIGVFFKTRNMEGFDAEVKHIVTAFFRLKQCAAQWQLEKFHDGFSTLLMNISKYADVFGKFMDEKSESQEVVDAILALRESALSYAQQARSVLAEA